MGKLKINAGLLREPGRWALIVGVGVHRRQRQGDHPSLPAAPCHLSSPGWSDPRVTRAVRAAARAPGDGPLLAVLPAAERAWLDELHPDLAADVLDGVRAWAAD